MNIKIGRYRLVIEIEDAEAPVIERRKMARAVDDMAKADGREETILLIRRITAYRKMTGAGLVEGKVWCETAFKENGRGEIA